MAFKDGALTSIDTLKGQYLKYSFKTKKYEKPINCMYSEEQGLSEEIVETEDDFQENSKNITLSSFENLPFKSQDKFITQEGDTFKIINIDIEPDPNIYRTKFADRRKFQKKILFME